MNSQTAISYFAYKRPDHMKKSLQSLVENDGFREIKCFLFIDGPKNEDDEKFHLLALEVAQAYADLYPNIELHIRKENLGLRESIKSGLDEVFEIYTSVIVLEDDIIISKLFLRYMLTQLQMYESDISIGSIAGYKEGYFPLFYKGDTILSKRQSCWGWATWRDRWKKVDWQKSEIESREYEIVLREISKIGSDLGDIFQAQQMGLIDSWAIDFDRTAALLGWRAVHPKFTLVVNSGFDGTGTHFTTEHTKKEKIPYIGNQFNMTRRARTSSFYDLLLRFKFSRFSRSFNKLRVKFFLVKNKNFFSKKLATNK